MKPLLLPLGICVRPIGFHLPVCTRGPVPLLGVSLVHVLGPEVSVGLHSVPPYLHGHLHVCWADYHVRKQNKTKTSMLPLCFHKEKAGYILSFSIH